MKNWENRVVWITGASSGIGKALALEFSKRKAYVILSSRRENELVEVQKELDRPDMSKILPLDLLDQSEFDSLSKKAFDWQNKLDCLIHSGGISQRGEAGSTSLDVDRKIMEVNYFGTIALTKAVLPMMRKQGFGCFVPISSIAGKFGFFLRSAYSASKHALQGFFESLLLEEAKNNIQVTLIYPGKINTPISVSAINEKGEAHGVMDHNQETGMPAEECALKMISAIEKQKKEALIGNKEIKAVKLKRFFPRLFWKVIAKQSAT